MHPIHHLKENLPEDEEAKKDEEDEEAKKDEKPNEDAAPWEENEIILLFFKINFKKVKKSILLN